MILSNGTAPSLVRTITASFGYCLTVSALIILICVSEGFIFNLRYNIYNNVD